MRLFSLFLIIINLSACAPTPPADVQNICHIFSEYPKWYWITKKTEKKWGVPIYVQMAIMYQESRFRGSAKPDRQKVLGFIPWKRTSNAYGYTQAKTETWNDYQKQTNSTGARDRFSSSSDFVGWYIKQANKQAGIAKDDTYNIYLAYHEGIGGYMRKTYMQKSWLINVAQKVNARAALYQSQLPKCEKKLKKKWWQMA